MRSLLKEKYRSTHLCRSWDKNTSCKNNIIRRKLTQSATIFLDENKVFKAVADTNKEKFYCLSKCSKPSGRLHMGHVSTTLSAMLFLATSACRVKTYFKTYWVGMAFGLPAENELSKHKTSPHSSQYGQLTTSPTWKASLRTWFWLWIGIVKSQTCTPSKL